MKPPGRRDPPESGDEGESSESGAPDFGDQIVPVEITDSIDLHGFAPRDIEAAVMGYLEAAQERGFVEVRLIHGKGKGVQRSRVRQLLARHTAVESFFDGVPGRGAWGATIVRLRRQRS